ncbi:MAG TPA: shikimate dehydrogenase [Stellaceae bacterium]|nr:shikimate dehydrogenase [Stellaceae bacterium]
MTEFRPFRLAGVIGWPVSHSRSPALHGFWLREHAIAGAYLPMAVRPEALPAALKGLPALGFAGCNVTIPHKVAAMALVDEVDPLARRIGALNTVVVRADGTLLGLNTDAEGYGANLAEAQPGWRADRGPAVVLGAGGGARAVIASLTDRGAPEIRVLNRTLARAQALADEIGPPLRALPWERRSEALGGAALLVNTTSQGMAGQPPLEISLDRLSRDTLVCDIVYIPCETPLLLAARSRGNPTVDGLGMLLHQAVPAFRAFFGVTPKVTSALRQAIEATL